MTRNESLVFEELAEAEKPLTAYALLDRMRVHGLRSPLQVYRALEKLRKSGLVHKLERLNAFFICARKNEKCGLEKHGLSIFRICESCDRVDEVCDEMIETRLEEESRHSGFHIKKTTVEIYGACRMCCEEKTLA